MDVEEEGHPRSGPAGPTGRLQARPLGRSDEGSLPDPFGETAAACAGGSTGAPSGGPISRSAGRSGAAPAGGPVTGPAPSPRSPRKRARSTAARTCSPVISSRPSCSRRTANETRRPSTPLTRARTSTGRPAKAGPVWSTATRVPTPASPGLEVRRHQLAAGRLDPEDHGDGRDRLHPRVAHRGGAVAGGRMEAFRSGDAVRNGAHLFVRLPGPENDARESRMETASSSLVSCAACRMVRDRPGRGGLRRPGTTTRRSRDGESGDGPRGPDRNAGTAVCARAAFHRQRSWSGDGFDRRTR